MSVLRKTSTIVAVAAFATFLAFMFFLFILIRIQQSVDRTVVTSQSILQEITDEYFVVTKTVYLNQDITITIDQGSRWSNFWWGQEIEAEATVRADIGVDLSGLSESDIVIDHEEREVLIYMPEAEILLASVEGDIEAATTQGVLKRLLDNDPNEDFNLAKQQLIEDAKTAVKSREDIFESAQADAVAVLELIVSSFDYQLITEIE